MASLYSFYDWVDRLRRYYRFSKSESAWLVGSILIMSFIVGFRFEGDAFVLSAFIDNFALGLLAVAIAVFAHESAHRIFGLNMGYKTQFKPALYGLIAGLILAFMSSGRIVFLAYSGVALNIMEKHRLGYFRYQLGYFDLGKVSLMGPLANLMVAIVVKMLPFIPEAMASQIIFVNVLFAITNIMPIPPLDGANVLFAAKTLYLFIAGAIVSCGLLLLMSSLNPWLAIAASLLIGFIVAVAFFHYVEPKLGK